MRLAMHPSLDYASAFSPGPYCERPDQGFTFNCPGAASVMHVIPKSKIYIPYQLNENGFRGPFRSPPSENSDKPTRIVLVGGQSQSFGAYLPDRDTFAAVAARSACNQVEISLAAFPGMTDAQSWRIYSQSAEAVPKSTTRHPSDLHQHQSDMARGTGPEQENSIWTVPYVDVWLDPTGPLVDHTSGPEVSLLSCSRTESRRYWTRYFGESLRRLTETASGHSSLFVTCRTRRPESEQISRSLSFRVPDRYILSMLIFLNAACLT